MRKRLSLLATVVSTVAHSVAVGQARPFRVSTDLSDTTRAVHAQFVGWYQADSTSVRVRVDSARIWVRQVGRGPERETIGGFAPLLAGFTADSGWSVWADGDVQIVGTQLAAGDSVRPPTPVLFTIDRSRLAAVDGLWLSFEVLLNRLNVMGTEPDVNVVTTYVQGTATLGGMPVPPAREDTHGEYREPRPFPGTCHASSLGRTHGRVQLDFAVDSSGLVEPRSFRVYTATEPALVDVALFDVRRCRFAPASLDGRPIRVRLVRSVNY